MSNSPSKTSQISTTPPPVSNGSVWGEFDVAMPPEVATATLANVARALSRQGKLPGYRAGSDSKGDVIAFHGFGEPWDFEVSAKVSASTQGSKVHFEGRMLPKAPAVFALVGVLSVWPGVWLTDSMLKVYFKGYDWNTYLWYIPLTVLPLPWMAWRIWNKSNRAAREHAAEKVQVLHSAMKVAGSP